MEKFNVLIEIPKDTVNEKYEFDHKTGKMVLDFVFENLVWPFNYGEVVGTLGGDGDALDAMVFSTQPFKQSAVVQCTPFGIARVIDRGEVDDKLLMVPINDPLAEKYKDISDFTETERENIVNFYNEVARQKKKIMEVNSFEDKAQALQEIKNSLVK